MEILTKTRPPTTVPRGCQIPRSREALVFLWNWQKPYTVYGTTDQVWPAHGRLDGGCTQQVSFSFKVCWLGSACNIAPLCSGSGWLGERVENTFISHIVLSFESRGKHQSSTRDCGLQTPKEILTTKAGAWRPSRPMSSRDALSAVSRRWKLSQPLPVNDMSPFLSFFLEKGGSWMLQSLWGPISMCLIDTPGLTLVLIGHSTDVLWPQLSSLMLSSLTVPVQVTWLPAEFEVGTGWGDFWSCFESFFKIIWILLVLGSVRQEDGTWHMPVTCLLVFLKLYLLTSPGLDWMLKTGSM